MTAHVSPPTSGYMFTLTGIYYPLKPRVEDVHVEDIAHHLAMQCRYNGATTDFYSVAEHSYWCSYQVPAEDALEALLHDAAEAYIGDFIRPLKRLPQFEPYLDIELWNEEVIAERFKLRHPWPASVKRADEAIAAAETQQIIASKEDNYCTDLSVIADVKLACWPPNFAKVKFMGRFNELRRN